MARNRKTRDTSSSASSIPLKRPSEVEQTTISEEEQWRIIKETGILDKLPQDPKAEDASEEDQYDISPLADEVFNAVNLIIPMSFVLLLMEILVHYQYGRKPGYDALVDRMLPGVPIISVFVFYTNRYKAHKSMQIAFFWLSCLSGSRLVWLINRGNWRVVMQQSPPLAVAWVYAVLQLQLGPSVLSLLAVAGWGYYKNMKIFI